MIIVAVSIRYYLCRVRFIYFFLLHSLHRLRQYSKLRRYDHLILLAANKMLYQIFRITYIPILVFQTLSVCSFYSYLACCRLQHIYYSEVHMYTNTLTSISFIWYLHCIVVSQTNINRTKFFDWSAIVNDVNSKLAYYSSKSKIYFQSLR